MFISHLLAKVKGMEKLTPMMQQYHTIKQEHPDKLVFFRLGDFYEMFYDDAVLGSRELEITLTSRNSDSQGRRIPMCGVPHHSVNSYLARLIKKGHKVAICEQMEEPTVAKGIVRREVARIVTPGMVLDEGVLNSRENNYIGCLVEETSSVGASFLDLSTGYFVLVEFSGDKAWPHIRQELERFCPRELILPETEQDKIVSHIPDNVRAMTTPTPVSDWSFREDYSHRVLLEHFKVASLEGFGLNGQCAAVSAAGALLHYIKQTQKSSLSHVTEIHLMQPAGDLKLDQVTVENLELIRGLDGNRKGTLLSTLDFTNTSMGARLLRNRLLRPSCQVGEINQRLNAVEELHSSTPFRDRLRKLLQGIQDIERLLGRVTMEVANARDLLGLGNSLQQLPAISELLQRSQSVLLKEQIDLLEDVTDLLNLSIAEDPPVSLSGGGLIRKGFNQKLDNLREIATSGKSFLAQLEAKERERTGISSLKVKFNRVFGYFLEITRKHLDSVPADYVRKQTLVGCERFVTPKLKEYEEKVLTAEEQIIALEKELFLQVRNQVGIESVRIRQVAQIIAQVDTLAALAEAAKKYTYVRPHIDEGKDLEIQSGRHPMVEGHSSEPFTPNDLFCNNSSDQLLILTGPNMGGKSTYLRQNALIVILAQMGSFVPARKAHIGLVDRIYTRVGASDNLARGRSTFMVEMIETAHILNTATSRSLILLDEVGRGTSTFDGLSIAWSVAEFLLNETGCRARTLFATHYQELTKLENLYEGVKNYCVTIQENGQEIIFFHRILPGAANRSYGIEVARLAGLPPPVIERARTILSRLERKEIDLSNTSPIAPEVIEKPQKLLF